MESGTLRSWTRKLTVAIRPNALTLLGQRFVWRQLGRSRRQLGLSSLLGAAILLYHRVCEVDSDPQLLCVSPENFSQHLEFLSRHYTPITLQELVQRIAKGQSIAGCVVVTFDDGYADNLHEAKPLLERHGVPATVFVVTSHLGTGNEFWWDELDHRLLQPGLLPAELRLKIRGRWHHWSLGRDAEYGVNAHRRNRAWHLLLKATPTQRHRVYRSLYRLLAQLDHRGQQDVLAQLRVWANAGCEGRSTHRALTKDELARLAAGDIVEVGAHTDTHPVLSSVDISCQMSEIAHSKARLEEILGRSVVSFAYPYGAITDYKGETVRLVRDAGFTCACSNFPDLVRPHYDPFQLPRYLVRNSDGESFGKSMLDVMP